MKAARMLAVNPNAIREKDDFYATDPAAIRIALPMFQRLGLSENIWECACGKGHLSEALKQAGYCVYSSDLVDRGYGDVKDFLAMNVVWKGDIITNPPFKLAEEFIRHSLDVLEEGRSAYFLLKIQFIQSQERKKLFDEYPPHYIIVHSRRIYCAMNGDFANYAKWSDELQMWTGGTQSYCWFVWTKGYKGDCIVKWV